MVTKIRKQIHSDLEAQGNPYRKEKIAGYLKTSTLDFIGVELPDIHKIVKRNIKGMELEDLPELMAQLWKIETFETRVSAIDVLKVYAKKGPVEEAMMIADRWVDDADTWAITDPLSSPVIGSLILRDTKVEKILESKQAYEIPALLKTIAKLHFIIWGTIIADGYDAPVQRQSAGDLFGTGYSDNGAGGSVFGYHP